MFSFLKKKLMVNQCIFLIICLRFRIFYIFLFSMNHRKRDSSLPKGSKPPSDFLKNPAGGGQMIGSLSSSSHSPLAGTSAREGQAPPPAQTPFSKAIFNYITTNAESDGVKTDPVDVNRFAIRYASMYPDLQFKFTQTRVQEALVTYQDDYAPPEPLPLPRREPRREPRPEPRNPNNIFGQLLRLGRHIRIPNQNLIDYLKWFTSQPHIHEIAENPSLDEIQRFSQQMIEEISPGAVMFRKVCESGLSSDTLGSVTFQKLMQMKLGPQIPVYAMRLKFPLKNLIHALSFKGEDGIPPYTSCFISGFFFNPNGEEVFFNFPDLKESGKGWDSDYMHGKPVFFWISRVGQVRYLKKSGYFDKGQYDYATGEGFAGGGIVYDDFGNVCTWGKIGADSLHAEMVADREAFFNRPHVTAPDKQNLNVGENHNLEREIRGNHKYQAACEKALAQIGCMPVLFCSTSRRVEAVEAVEAAGSDQSDEAAIFERCYHDNRVKAFGEYSPCQSCKLHPGKGAIRNGWGDVVGYRQAP
jgi:hypothetical protein